MRKINAHTEMTEAIAMLAFVNSSLTAIHEQPGNYLASEKESYGLQQILFHIEARLEGVKECLTDGMTVRAA